MPINTVPFTLENLQRVTHLGWRSNGEIVLYYLDQDGNMAYIHQGGSDDEWSGSVSEGGFLLVLKLLQCVTGKQFIVLPQTAKKSTTLYLREDCTDERSPVQAVSNPA